MQLGYFGYLATPLLPTPKEVTVSWSGCGKPILANPQVRVLAQHRSTLQPNSQTLFLVRERTPVTAGFVLSVWAGDSSCSGRRKDRVEPLGDVLGAGQSRTTCSATI